MLMNALNRPRRQAGARRRHWLAAAGLALTFGAPVWLDEAATAVAPESAAQWTGIGYVEKIVGELREIRIERDGRLLTPALLLPLQAGDRVTALAPGSELYAQVGNRRIVVTFKNSPYSVHPVDAPPGFITRLGSTLMSVGARLTTQYVRSSSPVSTSSRGREGPLSMPLVHDGVSRIGAHRAALALAWDGGAAPFHVEIRGPEGQALAAADTEEWRARLPLPSPGLVPGLLHIVIQDRTGDRMRRSVEVVSQKSVPANSTDLADPDLAPELRTLLTADFLVQTHRRIWTLEAYQDVAPLADSYEPARLLRDCLEATPSCYHQ
jgi:hypothetical protein